MLGYTHRVSVLVCHDSRLGFVSLGFVGRCHADDRLNLAFLHQYLLCLDSADCRIPAQYSNCVTVASLTNGVWTYFHVSLISTFLTHRTGSLCTSSHQHWFHSSAEVHLHCIFRHRHRNCLHFNVWLCQDSGHRKGDCVSSLC